MSESNSSRLVRPGIPRSITISGCLTLMIALGLTVPSFAQPSPNFAPLEAWRAAIASADAAHLRVFYSTTPPARLESPDGVASTTEEVDFWIASPKTTPSAVRLEELQITEVRPGVRQTIGRVELVGSRARGAHTEYVNVAMLWAQQGTAWYIVVGRRVTGRTRLRQPLATSTPIYPAGHEAHADIQSAMNRAAPSHKNVLVVFGADWCWDCHVLDLAFERGEVANFVKAYFEVVHVDIGQGEKNQDLMKLYDVPINRGIPAVAVLDGNGKLLASQRSGEFASARSLSPEDLEAFLLKWKPKPKP